MLVSRGNYACNVEDKMANHVVLNNSHILILIMQQHRCWNSLPNTRPFLLAKINTNAPSFISVFHVYRVCVLVCFVLFENVYSARYMFH